MGKKSVKKRLKFVMFCLGLLFIKTQLVMADEVPENLMGYEMQTQSESEVNEYEKTEDVIEKEAKGYKRQDTYTISYNTNGGSGGPKTQIKEHGKAIKLSTVVPKRTGYSFEGWATTSTAVQASYQAGTTYLGNKSLRLYAVWKLETYTITYDANGGNGGPVSQQKTYNKDLKISGIRPKKNGYTFAGWAKSRGASRCTYKSGEVFKENKDTKLYAVWKIKTYSVVYDANGGSNSPSSQVKTYGRDLVLSKNKPKRENYLFAGWAKEKNSMTCSYKPGGTYKANASIRLYAVWIRDAFQIQYDANGGVGAPISQMKRRSETISISKTRPYKSGYTFLGWGKTPNARTISYYPGDRYAGVEDMKLYAMWGKSIVKTKKNKESVCFALKDWGVVTSTVSYTEDYMKYDNMIAYYNHHVYLEVDSEFATDEYELAIYPPLFIRISDETNKTSVKCTADVKEDYIGSSDYIFARVSRKKQMYNMSDSLTGTCAATWKYGSVVKTIEVKQDLSGVKRTKLYSEDSVNDGGKETLTTLDDYYCLGKIQRGYLCDEKKGYKKNNEVIARWNGKRMYRSDIAYAEEAKENFKNGECIDLFQVIKKNIIESEVNDQAILYNCVPNESEVNEKIQTLKEQLKNAQNCDIYLKFIEGTGLEEDEYWEKYRNELVYRMARENYIEKAYAEYIEEGKITSYAQKDILDAINEQNAQGEILTKRDFIYNMYNVIYNKQNVKLSAEFANIQ